MAAVPPVAPVGPAAAVAPPAVVAPVTTSRELHDQPESDTHAGDYAAVLQASCVPATHADWARAGESRVAPGSSVTTNAYVGLFATPGSDPGRTRLLHAPRGPPAVIGRPTAHDGRACASLDDVAAGAIQAVDSRGDLFDITPGVTISTTPAIGAASWAADPALTVVAPVTAAGQGRGARVPRLMCVPPRHIRLFIDRRLTPRQLIEEALVAIEADGDTADMAPFVDWCLAAGTGESDGDGHPPLCVNDITAPLGDATFIEWGQAHLNRLLPELAGSTAAASVRATTRIASLMAQVLRGQRDTREDAKTAREAAQAPKTVSDCLKTRLTNKLMAMCRVTSEDDLPEVSLAQPPSPSQMPSLAAPSHSPLRRTWSKGRLSLTVAPGTPPLARSPP